VRREVMVKAPRGVKGGQETSRNIGFEQFDRLKTGVARRV